MIMDYKDIYHELKHNDYYGKEFEYINNIGCCDLIPEPLFNDIEKYDFFEPINRLMTYYTDVEYYKELYDQKNNKDIIDILNKLPLKITNENSQNMKYIDEILLNYFMCFPKLKMGIYIDNVNSPTAICIKNLSLTKKETEGVIFQLMIKNEAFTSYDFVTKWVEQNKLGNAVNYLTVVIGEDVPNNSIITYSFSEDFIDALKLLFNRSSIDILNYQRLDRFIGFRCTYCEYIHNTLKNFISKTVKLIDRCRFLILSMSVLYSLGTSITRDLDLHIHPIPTHSETPKFIDNVLTHLIDKKTRFPFVDGYMRGYDGWVIGGDKEYMFDWTDREWPNMYGAVSMTQTSFDPQFHYYFRGLKLICLEAEIQRRAKRTRANGYVDLIALRKFNGIYRKMPPLPEFTYISHKKVMIDDRFLNSIYRLIQIRLKEWFNINLSIDDIKGFILNKRELKRLESYEMYKDVGNNDPETKFIKRFNNRLKSDYIRRYMFGIKLLIDIGSGKSSDLFSFNLNRIKKVIAIEPSQESHNIAINKYQSMKNSKNKMFQTTEMVYINGLGQENWQDANKFTLSEESKITALHTFKEPVNADAISLFHVIHYMNTSENEILGLMKNITTQLKKGGILMILCMDGEYIHKKLKDNNGIYQIIKNNKTIYSIEAKYDLNTDITKKPYNNIINVFFSGVFGLTQGIDETLVSIDHLINLIKRHGFTVIENNSFIDVKNRVRETSTIDQLVTVDFNIIRLYRALVFRKIYTLEDLK